MLIIGLSCYIICASLYNIYKSKTFKGICADLFAPKFTDVNVGKVLILRRSVAYHDVDEKLLPIGNSMDLALVTLQELQSSCWLLAGDCVIVMKEQTSSTPFLICFAPKLSQQVKIPLWTKQTFQSTFEVMNEQ